MAAGDVLDAPLLFGTGFVAMPNGLYALVIRPHEEVRIELALPITFLICSVTIYALFAFLQLMAAIEGHKLGGADLAALAVITSLTTGQIKFLLGVIRNHRNESRTESEHGFAKRTELQRRLSLIGASLILCGLITFVSATIIYICAMVITKDATALKWLLIGILGGPLVAGVGAIFSFISSIYFHSASHDVEAESPP